MRIVADTNTVVSGLIWHGAPRQLMNAARSGNVQLYTSAVLLAEFARVLGRGKFIKSIQQAGLSVENLLADYATLAVSVAPVATPRVVKRDPDDDHVIACALAAKADAIVSGDRDLLDLGEHQGIAILTASEAIKRIT